MKCYFNVVNSDMPRNARIDITQKRGKKKWGGCTALEKDAGENSNCNLK